MSDSIAKIDAARARRIAGMLIEETSKAEASRRPDEIVTPVREMDAEAMLATYNEKRSRFQVTPFDPDGKYLRFFPGEWTIISGKPGGGKSALIRQQICSILRSGSGVFAASLEQDPQDFVVQLAATAAGVDHPDVNQLTWFIETYGKRLRVWNGDDANTTYRQLLATARGLAAKGFRHAFIDSLMCLDISDDDYAEQKELAKLVRASAIAGRGHIYLVAHPKKTVQGDAVPDLQDVAGNSSLTRLAFNVAFVRRGEAEHIDANNNPIQMLIRKQRTLGIVGELNGWFHRNLNQISLNRHTVLPTRYLPDAAYAPVDVQDELPPHIIETRTYQEE